MSYRREKSHNNHRFKPYKFYQFIFQQSLFKFVNYSQIIKWITRILILCIYCTKYVVIFWLGMVQSHSWSKLVWNNWVLRLIQEKNQALQINIWKFLGFFNQCPTRKVSHCLAQNCTVAMCDSSLKSRAQ